MENPMKMDDLGVPPIAERFILENPMKMDDLGVPPFLETSKSIYNERNCVLGIPDMFSLTQIPRKWFRIFLRLPPMAQHHRLPQFGATGPPTGPPTGLVHSQTSKP